MTKERGRIKLMNLPEFISAYTGKTGVGDTAANKGQCVGLIQEWLNQFGFPQIWGNAIDLLHNADRNFYTVIGNSPSNFPLPGDIAVFGAPYGQYKEANGDIKYYGHTGIVVSADVNTLSVFEQNNPIAATPRVVKHSYKGVTGWIRMRTPDPKPVEPKPSSEQSKVSRDVIVEYYRGVDLKGLDPSVRESIRDAVQTWWDVAHGNVYIRQSECSALSNENQGFKDNHKDCDDIKSKYNAFVALGYNTVEDVQKALREERDKFTKLSEDQVKLEKKNADLARIIEEDAKNNYTAMEEGIKTVEEKERLEQEQREIAKAVGVNKPSITKIMDGIFRLSDLAERWIKQAENKNDTSKTKTKSVFSITTSNFFTKILKLIPESKKGGAK